jgi:EAL domain-containing protein (putative c-di-GMP-specific phosphodiesterase class I)
VENTGYIIDLEVYILEEEQNILPELILIEITETQIMNDPGFVIKTLTEILNRGIKLEIDDFEQDTHLLHT